MRLVPASQFSPHRRPYQLIARMILAPESTPKLLSGEHCGTQRLPIAAVMHGISVADTANPLIELRVHSDYTADESICKRT